MPSKNKRYVNFFVDNDVYKKISACRTIKGETVTSMFRESIIMYISEQVKGMDEVELMVYHALQGKD